ncbi:MAG: carboxypeptidase-like regulatory domain-containing protein [Chitinophagaceae bacterium]|nr:carboxypeptidase-like regulatory domain-containing protein [Chitinophagaceae bacterium]
MEEKHKHIEHYTAQDIQRYLHKQMTSAEMHAFEKASLEDPFLAEALEGYIDTPVASVPADIQELEERLQEKNKPALVIPFYRKVAWTAAAAILIIFGAAATWLWLKPSTEKTIAQKKENQQQTVEPAEKSPAAAPALQDSVPPVASSPEAGTSQSSVTEKTRQSTGRLPSPGIKKAEAPKTAATEAEAQLKADDGDIATAPSKDIQQQEDKAVAKKAEAQAADNVKSRSAVSNVERAQGNRNAAPSIPAYIFKGKITDNQHKPLPFVNINIPGTGSYAYTDANGNFNMMHGDTQLVVHVKSVGFQPENFTLHSNVTSNNINLKKAQNELADVVVVGYGKQAKKKLTGNTDKADDEETGAEPADGWSNYDLYLLNNERLPQQGYNKLMGSVELSFTVNKYGNISDINIENSTCPLCEKEAIRLIKEGPKWKLTKGTIPKKITVTLQF